MAETGMQPEKSPGKIPRLRRNNSGTADAAHGRMDDLTAARLDELCRECHPARPYLCVRRIRDFKLNLGSNCYLGSEK